MDNRRRIKGFLYLGAFVGAGVSIAVSLLMDTLYADALGGTWRDAITSDLKTFFSVSVSKDSALVFGVFILILTIMALFGALMGFIFGFLVYRFFAFFQGHER